MKKILSSLILSLIVISGCWVASIYPLYTPETLIEMPGLDGEWNAGKEKWVFEFNDSLKMYSLTLYSYWTEPLNVSDEMWEAASSDSTIKKDTAVPFKEIFEVGIVKLGGNYFMDLYPNSPNQYNEFSASSTYWNGHHIAIHTISKLLLIGDSLRICFLNNDWVVSQLDPETTDSKNPDFNKLHALPVKDDQVLLTAKSQELQEFCSKYAQDTLIFPEPDGLMIKSKPIDK